MTKSNLKGLSSNILQDEEPILTVAYSPCPNDTFLFRAWVEGKIEGAPPIQPILTDIQKLNERLHEGLYPITKASVASIRQVLDEYIVLPVGAAIGYGCGPKLVSNAPCTLEEIREKRVALPGEDTTAHLLFEHLCPNPKEKIFCSYDQIMDKVIHKEVDLGVIIHESRFSFASKGLKEVADLGELWEKKTHLPIPLGVLVAKRSLGNELLQKITRTLQHSLDLARKNSQILHPYITEHSQEKDPVIIQKHIDLYVTEETKQLSTCGMKSIATLLRLNDTTADWLLPIEPDDIE